MFVQNLNERQQGVLLHYADEVMRADGRIDASELLEMEMIRNQVEPGVTAEDVPIEQLPSLFEDRVSRISFLLELVGMGFANEDFDLTQSALVGEIARVFTFHSSGPASLLRQGLMIGEVLSIHPSLTAYFLCYFVHTVLEC